MGMKEDIGKKIREEKGLTQIEVAKCVRGEVNTCDKLNLWGSYLIYS